MSVASELWIAFVAIIKSPFVNLSALWVLIPIFLLWLVLEVYFDKYKSEKLGWNTALGNGISMFWVTVTLMKTIFEINGFNWARFFMVLVILAYALFISFISFKHAFSPRVVFLLASPTPIYYFTFIAVVVAYGSLELNWHVLGVVLIIFAFILGVVAFLRRFMPAAESSDSASDASFKDSDLSFNDSFGAKGGADFRI